MEQFTRINGDESQFSHNLESLLHKDAGLNKTELIVFYCIFAVLATFSIVTLYPVIKFLIIDFRLGIKQGSGSFMLMVTTIFITVCALVLLGFRNRWGWALTLVVLALQLVAGLMRILLNFDRPATRPGFWVGWLISMGLTWYLLRVPVQRLFNVSRLFRSRTIGAAIIITLAITAYWFISINNL